MSLFNELKRRNVFRVGIAYLVAVWIIAQVADLVLANIGAPQWVMQSLLLLLAIGFVVAIFIAWAYEVTPEGIKRESEVVSDVSVTHHTAKRLDIITIVLVVVAIGLLLTDRLLLDRFDQNPAVSGTAVTDEELQAAVIPGSDQSIAVMPFVALSTDENDEYFGKGIAEELLNALAKFPELKVAARTSAFSFGGKDVDLREVGETLGVAHILEGSVRRSGERLRITAQLIRVADGFHLWSETYERQSADIFDIQDEIVEGISRQLQFRLGVGAGSGRAADRNVNARAYEQYLRGLDLWWQRQYEQNRVDAVTAFRRATELDPDFADAWSAYGSSLSMSKFDPEFMSEQERRSRAEFSLQRAIELNPRNVRARSGLVYFHSNTVIDVPAAREHLRQALEIAPNDAFTHYAAAQLHWVTGEFTKMRQAFDRAISLDPLNRTIQRVHFQHLAGIGRYAETAAAIEMSANCIEGECDDIHSWAAMHLMMGALVSSNDNEVRRQKGKFAYNLQFMPDPLGPDSQSYIEFLQKFAEFFVDEKVDRDYWRSVDISGRFFGRCFLVVGSILAQVGEDDRALDFLSSQDGSKIFTGATECQYPLLPGRFELPERVRRDSRYHELWSSPDMQELAESRRANGQTAGLPMPTNSN